MVSVKLSILIGIAIAGAFAVLPTILFAAASPNAFLGGGNALSRANSGESRGLTNASPSSNLMDHLTFASTHGGRGEEVPPPKEDSDDGEGSESEEDAENSSLGKVTSNGNSNGNASGGNGGNGGNSSPGGLVRAGSVVSNSNAVNVINTNIVRISTR